MKNSGYQKTYKEKYSQKNKIVTFPITNIFYDEIRRRSILYDLSVNSYAKTIVTNFLSTEKVSILTKEDREYINQFIRISRGIATNINQIAHNSNMGERIDTNVLMHSLVHYEEEFKKFIAKS